MEIKGEYQLPGTRELLYEMLLDPEVLSRALPGVESLEQVSPDAYESSMRVGIASVRGQYSGRVEVQDRNPPDSFRLLIDGSGKPGGARATATINLQEVDGGTNVIYTADVKARGTIARLGGRLLGGVSRLLVGQFFKAIETEVQDRAA